MIALHRVCKVYHVGPVSIPALSDVSFTLERGDFVVLTGPSGAGKTTLLRLLYRDDVPTEGEVHVLEHDLSTLRRRRVAAERLLDNDPHPAPAVGRLGQARAA